MIELTFLIVHVFIFSFQKITFSSAYEKLMSLNLLMNEFCFSLYSIATVPHSLSPYPSEEEEQYFHSFPQIGCPTPPRNLQMEHKGENSVVLSWGPSKILDASCKEINKPLLGKYLSFEIQSNLII